jgi:DNA repair ATPase RecN
MNQDDPKGGVSIGHVSGGIHGSIIAGRDVKNAMINLGGQPTPADKDPTVEELQQLLAEIQQELAAVTAQPETLSEVSTFAPTNVQQIETVVGEVAQQVEANKEAPAAPDKLKKNLADATSLLSNILESAKVVAEKGGQVATAVQPLAEKLAPLVEKLGVAAFWVGKLWLLGG